MYYMSNANCQRKYLLNNFFFSDKLSLIGILILIVSGSIFEICHLINIKVPNQASLIYSTVKVYRFC